MQSARAARVPVRAEASPSASPPAPRSRTCGTARVHRRCGESRTAPRTGPRSTISSTSSTPSPRPRWAAQDVDVGQVHRRQPEHPDRAAEADLLPPVIETDDARGLTDEPLLHLVGAPGRPVRLLRDEAMDGARRRSAPGRRRARSPRRAPVSRGEAPQPESPVLLVGGGDDGERLAPGPLAEACASGVGERDREQLLDPRQALRGERERASVRGAGRRRLRRGPRSRRASPASPHSTQAVTCGR